MKKVNAEKMDSTHALLQQWNASSIKVKSRNSNYIFWGSTQKNMGKLNICCNI
jgi:hypothetical protein